MAGRTRRVVWTRAALDDLESVLAYIAEDSAEAASGVLQVVLDLAASLSGLSDRGRVVPELEDPAVREVFVYSYRLLYEITKREVRVLSFVHGARELRNRSGLRDPD